jgi:signal transduction histidine kinase/CheY-like chemotaxis protein/HPt (histidine-containing phosphotransfer) domain-containing protein
MTRADDSRRPEGFRTLFVAVTVVFLILGLSVEGVMTLYWVKVLEPRLESEAVSQAEILARSQAGHLAAALRAGDGPARARALVSAMDELLLLRDPNTETPFFLSVDLEVDYDAVQASPGTLDLHRGDVGVEGFTSEVPVFDAATAELLAIARFRVSDRFFRQLAGEVRKELLGVSAAVLVLLALVWAALLFVLRKLERQTFERHRAERELWQQESKYQRLVNSLSSYFVYGRDPLGRLSFVSDSVSKVLGHAPKDFAARYGDHLAEAAPRPLLEGSASGQSTYEIDLVDDSGSTHRIQLSEVPARGAGGELEGFEGIARDVTAERLFEAELRDAKDQAEAANRAKSQFLANMSHEIRTPLNAVLGMATLALKTELSGKQRSYLEKIRSSGRLLLEIVEDLLDLSKIEAGRLEMQRTDFDLDEVMAEIADVVGVRLGAKRLEILFSAGLEVPRSLRGDAVRLKQVLLNLVYNAIKFTDEGEIFVLVELIERRRERAELRFSVRDTGIGIAADELPRMFEPFTQADASSTRRYGGAGLGLAISRRLVTLLGGDLTAKSAPGEGSTFTFSAAFELPAEPVQPRRLADELRGLRVLVADDNATARRVLTEMLDSLTCRVTAAASGEEAIALFDQAARDGRPFQLAVLDWKMPGVDGMEVARHVAQNDGARQTEVILVTAYDREEASIGAEAAGIRTVLPKPISPSALHDAIVHTLEPPAVHTSRTTGAREIHFARDQRVLLVEDNPINREVARELLASAGLAVEEAHHGREAIAMLERETFDAVLMDVQMPEMDGLEAIAIIRRMDGLAELPVIAMTAHAMMGDRERFLAAGMSDYLAKPIDEETLLRVLSRWLRVAPANTPRSGPVRRVAANGDDGVPGLAVEEGIRRLGGNPQLYRSLTQLFEHQLTNDLVQVKEMLGAAHRQDAQRVLHALKGAAATVAANRVARAAAALEATLGGDGDCTAALAELEAAGAEVFMGIWQLEAHDRADSGNPASGS